MSAQICHLEFRSAYVSDDILRPQMSESTPCANTLEGGNMFQQIRTSSSRLLTFWGALCLLTILLLCPGAHGQVDQGTITGSVEDSTGAVVPGAQVTLTNTDTDLVLQRAANSTGNFVFSPLKIGNYKLSATAPRVSNNHPGEATSGYSAAAEFGTDAGTGCRIRDCSGFECSLSAGNTTIHGRTGDQHRNDQ